jgi:hypothetical protein
VCLDCSFNTYTPDLGSSACIPCPTCTESGFYSEGCSGTSSGGCTTCTNTLN